MEGRCPKSGTDGGSFLARVHEKNRYGQKKSYLANFRAIWNTEQYSELLGIVAVMIPVDAVRDSMNDDGSADAISAG